jgi:hypothetical protein
MKKLLMSAVAAAAIAGGIASASAASAEPTCPRQYYYDPADRMCHLGSHPNNGYDPYDPSGKGWLGGLGPDSSWE